MSTSSPPGSLQQTRSRGSGVGAGGATAVSFADVPTVFSQAEFGSPAVVSSGSGKKKYSMWSKKKSAVLASAHRSLSARRAKSGGGEGEGGSGEGLMASGSDLLEVSTLTFSDDGAGQEDPVVLAYRGIVDEPIHLPQHIQDHLLDLYLKAEGVNQEKLPRVLMEGLSLRLPYDFDLRPYFMTLIGKEPVAADIMQPHALMVLVQHLMEADKAVTTTDDSFSDTFEVLGGMPPKFVAAVGRQQLRVAPRQMSLAHLLRTSLSFVGARQGVDRKKVIAALEPCYPGDTKKATAMADDLLGYGTSFGDVSQWIAVGGGSSFARLITTFKRLGGKLVEDQGQLRVPTEQLLKHCHAVQMTQSQVDYIIGALDADSSGSVEYETFEAEVSRAKRDNALRDPGDPRRKSFPLLLFLRKVTAHRSSIGIFGEGSKQQLRRSVYIEDEGTGSAFDPSTFQSFRGSTAGRSSVGISPRVATKEPQSPTTAQGGGSTGDSRGEDGSGGGGGSGSGVQSPTVDLGASQTLRDFQTTMRFGDEPPSEYEVLLQHLEALGPAADDNSGDEDGEDGSGGTGRNKKVEPRYLQPSKSRQYLTPMRRVDVDVKFAASLHRPPPRHAHGSAAASNSGTSRSGTALSTASGVPPLFVPPDCGRPLTEMLFGVPPDSPRPSTGTGTAEGSTSFPPPVKLPYSPRRPSTTTDSGLRHPPLNRQCADVLRNRFHDDVPQWTAQAEEGAATIPHPPAHPSSARSANHQNSRGGQSHFPVTAATARRHEKARAAYHAEAVNTHVSSAQKRAKSGKSPNTAATRENQDELRSTTGYDALVADVLHREPGPSPVKWHLPPEEGEEAGKSPHQQDSGSLKKSKGKSMKNKKKAANAV